MSARQQLLDELRAEQLQDLDALLAEQLTTRPPPYVDQWTPAQQAEHRAVAHRESMTYERAHGGQLCQHLRAVG